jgi:hypothetical protein
MSETVKASSIGVTAAIGRTYQNPTPCMMKAMGYTRALVKGREAVEAELYVRPFQSIVMKTRWVAALRCAVLATWAWLRTLFTSPAEGTCTST